MSANASHLQAYLSTWDRYVSSQMGTKHICYFLYIKKWIGFVHKHPPYNFNMPLQLHAYSTNKNKLLLCGTLCLTVFSFLSIQQVKEFFKLVQHLQCASLLFMSAQCFIWIYSNLPHFSPLHEDSFVFTSLQMQES